MARIPTKSSVRTSLDFVWTAADKSKDDIIKRRINVALR